MNESYEMVQNNRGVGLALPVMRSLRFWAVNILQSLGIALGAGVVFALFMAMQTSGGFTSSLRDILSMFPYYLMMAGGFTLMMYATSVFQTYFSLLVSMNVTRKIASVGTVVSTGVLALGICLMMGIFWKLIPGEISEKSLRMFPLYVGIMFIVSGIMLLIGVVIARWGKIGVIIMGIVGAIGGGLLGAGAVIVDKELVTAIVKLADMDFRIITMVGIGIYAAVSVFAVFAVRKVEVRR